MHYAKLAAEGKLLLGGPFGDSAAGGMMICKPGVDEDALRHDLRDLPLDQNRRSLLLGRRRVRRKAEGREGANRNDETTNHRAGLRAMSESMGGRRVNALNIPPPGCGFQRFSLWKAAAVVAGCRLKPCDAQWLEHEYSSHPDFTAEPS